MQHQGAAILFTGLSGAGKTTTATTVQFMLQKRGCEIVLYDGDLLRKTISQDLGFSKDDREKNISRLAEAAAETTARRQIAICSVIAPYDSGRRLLRRTVEAVGAFYLVYLSTPIHICEQRDPKGLYRRARAGEIEHFTGVSDPYEVPRDADLILDTSELSPEEAADLVLHLIDPFLC